MSERKAEDVRGYRRSLDLIENMIPMAREVYGGQFLLNELDRLRNIIEGLMLEASERDQGYRFSDNRPLDAKQEPVGAHKVYSGR